MSESEKPVEAEVKERVVRHVVEFQNDNAGDKGDKDLEAELESKNNLLASLALKEFEERKEAIVERLKLKYGEQKGEEIAEGITSGRDVDSYENLLSVVEDEGSQTQKSKVPVGKVKSIPPSKGESYPTTQAMVDDIYEALERQKFNQSFNPKEYNAEEHQRLQSMADKLLENAILGIKTRGEIPRIRGISSCFKCGASMSGDTCPKCGYKNKSYQDRQLEVVIG